MNDDEKQKLNSEEVRENTTSNCSCEPSEEAAKPSRSGSCCG